MKKFVGSGRRSSVPVNPWHRRGGVSYLYIRFPELILSEDLKKSGVCGYCPPRSNPAQGKMDR